ncbi:InlB B-repeat-containing protein [Lachnospiraceae bacterium ZAX-1]
MFRKKDSLKIGKKALALLMAVVMAASIPIPFAPTIAAAAANAPSYGSNGKFLAPIDDADPSAIKISDAEELAKIGTEGYPLGGSYVLIEDIDLSGGEWTPIGSLGAPFTGTFDGQGHVIKKMTITGDVAHAGLFGYVQQVTVKNVGMEEGNLGTGVSVGGIVGFAGIGSNTISNCYNTGAISSPYSGNSNSHAGGIVGESLRITISDCYNTGDISASPCENSDAGGIAGCGTVAISNCYNTGDISSPTSEQFYRQSYNVGGIVGRGVSGGITISDCYNTGTISTPDSSYYSYAGGIIGDAPDITISDCYNTGDISSSTSSGFASYADAGGITGIVHGGVSTIRDCYNTGAISSSSDSSDNPCAGGIVGYGNGTGRNIEISDCYNTGAISAAASDYYSHAGGIVGDGIELTISGCYSTGAISSSSSSHESYAGGIVGFGNGNGSGSNIIIRDCYNTGDIASSGAGAASYAGGIVGYGFGNGLATNITISNCYNTGDISTTSDFPSFAYAGGIASIYYNGSTIENCVSLCAGITAKGSARNNPVIEVINPITEFNSSIIANASNLSVSPYTSTGNLSRNDIAGITNEDESVTQLPLADFYSQSTYQEIDWDFNTVWKMVPDYEFPQLMWQTEYTKAPDENPPVAVKAESLEALKAKTVYTVGDELGTDDLAVTATYSDGTSKAVTGYTTNASDIDMNTVGEKTLSIAYTENGTTVEAEVSIQVKAEDGPEVPDKNPPAAAKVTSLEALKVKTVYTVGDELTTDDLTVTATYSDSTSKEVAGYTTNASNIDMNTVGEKTLSIAYTENSTTVKATVSIQVNAKGEPKEEKTYTITFDANGGTGLSRSSIAVTQGAAIGALPSVSRTGYTLKGWYTDKSGGSKVESTTRPTKSQTIYAQWEQVESQAKTYTVTFDKNSGTKLSSTKRNVGYNQTIGELPTVQKKGYTFKGWYTEKKGGSKVTPNTQITKDQTLYAQWSKVAKPKQGGTPTLKNSKSKQLSVSYAKVNGAKGYEIAYSTSKKFTKPTTKSTTGTTLKKTIKSLKKGKTYYVKVRAYKTDSTGSKVYGSYGKAKSVEIKK